MKPEKIRLYFYSYLAGMLPVIIFFLARMWQSGIFNQRAAHSSIRPFFNDHTSFGAAIAFCIPVIIFFISTQGRATLKKIFLYLLLLGFFTAFIFSYSRAAWVSIAVAGVVSSLLFIKVSIKLLIPASLIFAIAVLIYLPSVILKLNENRQESSSNIESHLKSISNIRSDASNMERVNRWKSSIGMIKEKPFFGWGPATFQFKYAPFQISTDKTIISTNYGEGGNAHSEYLGAMVDSGVPGLILYLLLILTPILRGIVIWNTHRDKQTRYLSLALVAGLITYLIHGVLNNFLDTDKISALFWGMIAAITAIDIGMRDDKTREDLPEVGGDN